MVKYIEKDTEIPVSITTLRRLKDHPDVAVVTYPDGTTYGLLADRICERYDIVTPQTIQIGGDFALAYERCD